MCDVEGDDILVDRKHRFAVSSTSVPQDDDNDDMGNEARGGRRPTEARPRPLPSSARSLLPEPSNFSRDLPPLSVGGTGLTGTGISRSLGRGRVVSQASVENRGASGLSGSTPGRGVEGQGRGRGEHQGGKSASRGGRGAAGKLWVTSDGKIYNYAKAGAQEVAGRAEADHAVEAAKQASQVSLELSCCFSPIFDPISLLLQAIMGLGLGGNRGLSANPSASGPRYQWQADLMKQEEDGAEDVNSRAQQHQPRGQQAGRGMGGRGGERSDASTRAPNYDRKETNKAAIANHHRKDRAMRKMGL